MNFESLVNHISAIQDTLQAQAAHSVNLALTSRNWLMGCYIVEFEQHGEDRATYGEQLLKKVGKTTEYQRIERTSIPGVQTFVPCLSAAKRRGFKLCHVWFGNSAVADRRI